MVTNSSDVTEGCSAGGAIRAVSKCGSVYTSYTRAEAKGAKRFRNEDD